MASSGARTGSGAPPGSYKSMSASEAMKSAESLLEQKTIAEIREIEAKTRADIESKKQQLRQLVGDSYRDLISSADTIVQMADVCRQVVDNVVGIQSNFSGLVDNIAAAKGSKEHNAESLRHEELYAIGSRVKYLVDTPEMIWGCLDTTDFLEASHRFLRAEQVHALLLGSASTQAMRQFPLLRHQWPLVRKFRGQITERATAMLRGEAEVGAERAAEALAAVAFLSELDTRKALDFFLESRAAQLTSQLKEAMQQQQQASTSGAAGAGGDVDAVAEVLCKASRCVQGTVALAGDLFLAPYIEAGRPLLVAKAAGDGVSSSELLFGTLRNAQGDAGVSEVQAWEQCISAIRDRLEPLPPQEVAAACSAWIARLAEQHSGQLQALLEGCGGAQDLSAVELRVRSALRQWRKPVPAPQAGARKGSAPSLHPAAAGPGSLAPAGGPSSSSFSSATALGGTSLSALQASSLAAAAAAAADTTWPDVCDWVLQRRCHVWEEVLDAAYLGCVRGHIAGAFRAVADSLEPPLDACIRATLQAEAAPPAGACRTVSWPSDAPPLGDGGLARAGIGGGIALVGVGGHAGGVSLVGSGVVGGGWRGAVEALRAEFDSQLRDVLAGAVLLLEEPQEDVGGGGEEGGGGASEESHQAAGAAAAAFARRARGGGRRGTSARAAALEPYVQDRCADLLDTVAERMQARLAALPTPTPGPAGAPAVEAALCTARLVYGIASGSTLLGVILGSPAEWRDALTPGAREAAGLVPMRSSGSGGFKVRDQASRLDALQRRMRGVAMAGYGAWADWAATELACDLVASLEADGCLALTTNLRSWEETVVRQEGDAGAAAGDAVGDAGTGGPGAEDPSAEMRFSLPAAASSGTSSFLLAACAEVQRAGGHSVGTMVLAAFEWRVGEAALAALQRSLEPGSPLAAKLSEKGALQLLFDVRFMRDVLAGARPPPEPEPSSPLPASPQDDTSSTTSSTAAAVTAASTHAATGGTQTLAPRWQALECVLAERLDPIDWATYETYLWSNEARYYQRVGVLFGGLMQLRRLHVGTPIKSSVSADTNILTVAQPCARFSYLPISMPSSVLSAAAAGGYPGAAGYGPMPDKAAAAATGNYSFANIGGERAGNTSASSDAAAAAAASASTLEAIQSRFNAQRLGALGSLLGDKAAEVSAMAQGLGEMVPGSFATGSGFFSNLGRTFRSS